MTSFWDNKRVLVTGGTGFIGSHVVERLLDRGAIVRVLTHSGESSHLGHVRDQYELVKGDARIIEDAEAACDGQDIVMNLAARVGGIEYNRTHQATMLSDNMLIGSVMLEAARIANVKRFLVVSSACVYPSDAVIPTPESEGHRGEPEPTNGGYGWAKRMAERLGMYYNEEFGMKIAIARPYNCYGPRDHFDLKMSHVIPALIKRVVDGENPLSVWGSGTQTRAFLYVEDLAEGLIRTIEHYPTSDPVNLGSDEEVSIKDLVEKIIRISGVDTRVTYDTSKPDGSPRRNSDNAKAKKHLRFSAQTKLDEGLSRTIAWYQDHYKTV